MEIIASEIQIVHSGNREYGDDGRNFGIHLNLKRKDYNYFVVLQYYMLKNYYLINTGDTFTLSEGANNFTIQLTPANYTRRTLATEIQTQLNASGAWTYTVSYPSALQPDTGKLTISVAGGVPNITFPDKTQPAEAMGFVRNTTYTLTGGVVVSPNVQNTQKEATLILHCDRVPDGNLQELFAYDASNFGTLSFVNPSPRETLRTLIGNGTEFQFSISDENNEQIGTLNGADVIFSILFVKMIKPKTDKLLASILDASLNQ